MTSNELVSLILTRLVRIEGGSRQKWRRALGELRIYPLTTHPHCNWDFRAANSIGEVEAAIDWARISYPHILPD